jgi:hypothetical protein
MKQENNCLLIGLNILLIKRQIRKKYIMLKNIFEVFSDVQLRLSQVNKLKIDEPSKVGDLMIEKLFKAILLGKEKRK